MVKSKKEKKEMDEEAREYGRERGSDKGKSSKHVMCVFIELVSNSMFVYFHY